MRIISIIPARLASTRLAKKVLREISGKTMLERVWASVKSVAGIDEVFIATDHLEIEEAGRSFGAQVIMTSADHICGTDRIIEASKKVGAFDYIINVQADEVLIKERHLSPIIRYIEQHKPSIVTPHFANDSLADFRNPNKVKLVKTHQSKVLYFSRSSIPFTRDLPHGFSGSFDQHAGIYAFSTKVLQQIATLDSSPLELAEKLEQLRWLENNIEIHTVSIPGDLVGVDTLEDLEKVSLLISDDE